MKRIYEYEDLQPVLDELLLDKESGDLEFKSAKGSFPHSMWETYSSFANTDGGAIVFGVKEKDDQFFLDGLTKEQVRKYKKEFFDGMHNKQVVNIALLKENDVRAVEFEGAWFLFLYVPRVDRTLRPVYCGLDPYTGTYRRDLEGDYHCSREEVNSMYADANISNPVDGRIMENYSKEDLDSASTYSEEEISNERLQYALDMHKADITSMLGKMCEQHFLESSGRGRGTKYHVYGMNIALPKSNISSRKSDIPQKKSNISSRKSNISSKKKSNIALPKSNIPANKKSNITLANKRYTKDELRMLILGFCQEWRTAEEIAQFVDREIKYIAKYVLPKMDDVIEKMYDIPHHPRQKYRAKQKEADQ